MEQKNSGIKVGLIILHVLTLLTFLPWYAVFGLSFMSFDAGYSTQATVFVLLLGLYPIVSIVLSILAWVKLNKDLKKKAILLASSSLLLSIAFILFLTIVSLV